MRVIVTGSRDWADTLAVTGALDAISARVDDDIVVIHGACPTGADAIASSWVEERLSIGETTISEEPHEADWSKGGRAGPIRNAAMIGLGADVCLAFIGLCSSRRCPRTDDHESHGASGCAVLAERAGITTVRVYDDRIPVEARKGAAEHHVVRNVTEWADLSGFIQP